MTNKAFTIGRRGAWRDYVDIFFFMKWKQYTLSDIISLAEKRFGGEFNAKLFLGQLTYFDDIKIFETTFLKESYTSNQIQRFLDTQVKEYVRTNIPSIIR